MNELKTKSEFNENAAKLLIDNYLYAPSINCSYYSCYQFFKHIWLDKMQKTEEEFSLKDKSTNEGSHVLLYKLVLNYLEPIATDNRTIREIRNNVFQLKKVRTDADYTTKEIDSKISNDCLNLKDQIIRNLKDLIK